MAVTRFHVLLRGMIEEEVNKVKTDLASGSATDHAQYKFMAGQVFGMMACLQFCEEIEREIDERSHSGSGN